MRLLAPHYRVFGVQPILTHPNVRQDTNTFADGQATHIRTNRFDHAHTFVPDQRRKLRHHRIAARTEHDFGAVEADCLDLQAHLARAGLTDLLVLEPQFFGPTPLMNANNLAHRQTLGWPSDNGSNHNL